MTRKSDFTPHRYTGTFPTKKQEKKWRSRKMEKMVGAEYLTKFYGHRFLLQTFSFENLEFQYSSYLLFAQSTSYRFHPRFISMDWVFCNQFFLPFSFVSPVRRLPVTSNFSSILLFHVSVHGHHLCLDHLRIK